MDLGTALQILPRVISPVGWVAAFAAAALATVLLRRLGIGVKSAAALSVAWAVAVMVNLSPPRSSSWSGSAAVLDPQFPIFDVQIPTLSQLLTVNDFTVNLALFFPAGLVTALVLVSARSRRIGLTVLVVTPLVLEAIQASTPFLARVGTTSDAVYEALGAIVGFVLGSLVARRRSQQDAVDRAPADSLAG